ncbi:mitochondrial ATPase complex subunit ATP10 isoform X1 [Ziziphus jujuba]|uniref:Mitochondrial ATPase complex subunit ATP10 isoform X1 n=2 Tax=Ziziphus jujuba TaxID=326968 RepID=A0ABM3IBU7_ZIZJJ|nr:mitochondrial ATPase complex subunit ATP10 isoform X1 [Ziziphus jujuba]
MKRITRSSIVASQFLRPKDKEDLLSMIPLSQHFFAQRTSNRFLDIYQMGNKAAIEKERARLADEMNRGYFADISELKKHGGKIAMANKIIIPAAVAMKFPTLEVNFSGGETIKLPIASNGNGNVVDSDNSSLPKASLLCLSFRANSQGMIDSWTGPFRDAFHGSNDIQLYEVSFIDSWLLCRNPIKQLLLRIMRKSDDDGRKDVLKRQIVYSFGDHYYFRKELKILNLLTGYIFLLDKFGRIRWQGFGSATQDELSSLLSCTSLLLEEK